jgi:aryl-alcohol dehydrogenase-like predicted oxidoreductase
VDYDDRDLQFDGRILCLSNNISAKRSLTNFPSSLPKSCRRNIPKLHYFNPSLVKAGYVSHIGLSEVGAWNKERASDAPDFRSFSPRFQGENLDRNLALVETLRAIATAKDCTVAQLAIAWVQSRGADIVPLVGARKRDRLTESLGAVNLNLSAEDLAQIEQAIPVESVAGDRYAAMVMPQWQ